MEIKFCPKCKSRNVHVNITTSAAYGAPQYWVCEDCGFQSLIFPEIEIKLKRKKK